MPKINVKSTTHMTADDTFKIVKSFLAENKDIKNFDPEFNINFNDAARSGAAQGKVFAAKVKVNEQAQGCEVCIELELPMKFAMAKGMIQKTLQKKLDLSLNEI